MLGHASAPMTLVTYANPLDTDLETLGDALNSARAQANVGTFRKQLLSQKQKGL